MLIVEYIITYKTLIVWNSKWVTSSSRIDAFLSSDQNRCASKLLSAYEEGDEEEIKRVGQSSTISHLDHVVILPGH